MKHEFRIIKKEGYDDFRIEERYEEWTYGLFSKPKARWSKWDQHRNRYSSLEAAQNHIQESIDWRKKLSAPFKEVSRVTYESA